MQSPRRNKSEQKIKYSKIKKLCNCKTQTFDCRKTRPTLPIIDKEWFLKKRSIEEGRSGRQ